jgi:hypothetical protein
MARCEVKEVHEERVVLTLTRKEAESLQYLIQHPWRVVKTPIDVWYTNDGLKGLSEALDEAGIRVFARPEWANAE